MLDSKEMLDRLSSAVEILENRKKDINQRISVYDNPDQNAFSETWLSNTWQINLDIERINELRHEFKYNYKAVSQDQVKRLASWLSKKYDIAIL